MAFFTTTQQQNKIAQPGNSGAVTEDVTPTQIFFGAGSPAGVQVGSIGDIYINTTGGANTTFWIKESGVATTAGWAAK